MTINTRYNIQRIQSESGFSLIEVLIAIAIFAIGFLAVGLMQINAMNTTNSARRNTEAMTLCEDQAETLRTLPFFIEGTFNVPPDLAIAGDANPRVLNVDGPYTVRWTVDHNRPLPGYPAGVLDLANAVPNSMTIRVWVTPDNNPNDELTTIEFAKFCGDPI